LHCRLSPAKKIGKDLAVGKADEKETVLHKEGGIETRGEIT
jgi:hypothetical protein